MEIAKQDLDAIKDAGISIFLNEIKSHYLLGNTDEFDNFEPTKIDLKTCTPFDKFKYACCCYAGFKIEEDEAIAYEIWKECASEGQIDSMLEYSVWLFKEDKADEAFAQLQACANLGNIVAQFRIALCYMFAYGTEANEKKAYKIFEKLAEIDYPNAVYMLGSFYLADIDLLDIKANPVKAWELIKKACNLGSPFAQYEIAIQMCATTENKEFTPEIIQLIKASADNGDLRAQYLLSLAYAKGEGVEMDLELSMVYLAQSYDGGFPLAIELMEKIKNSIE